MTEGLENKDYHIYFDNFFTTVNLVQTMYKRNIFCCGTVRVNRKNLPIHFQSDKSLSRGHSDWFSRRDMISCIKWKDKRVVTLLSTIHSPTNNASVGKREKDGTITEIACPIAIKDYRRCMGCVNKADMLKSYYAIDRKSRKWWHRLFCHFLDTSIVNSYILFREKTGNKMKLKEFRLEVVSGLVGANSLKENLGRLSDTPAQSIFKVHVSKELRSDQFKHMPEYGISRRCAHCRSAKEPHRTRWSCSVCKVALCKSANKNCFVEFHKV
nr:piggyBac transposable element-derived protein 4-like [Leptinotarsa decemlineata]